MKKTLAATLIACSALVAFGQGTVTFSNNSLYRISTAFGLDYSSNAVPGTLAPAPTSVALEYGLFYGIGESTSLTLLTSQFGVSSSTGDGLIASPADSQTPLTLVSIPGTSPGETDVWLQMAAWSASFGTDYIAAHNAFLAGITNFYTSTWWGQSKIANITAGLGATTGPGAAIWTFSSNTTGTVIPAFVLVQLIPEPTLLALVALSTTMVMARRRIAAQARNNNSL
jgi:hypothetical protein